MLTFFRRIRKGLLDGSSTRKYIAYAIGEIALVVIGILIALQINNWNEERSNQQKLKVYLRNLTRTFREDIYNLDRVHQVNAFRYNSLHYILKIANYDLVWDEIKEPDSNFIWDRGFPESYDRELFVLGFRWSGRKNVMIINTTQIDELKNAGLFSYIKNDELKRKINEYYNQLFWRFGGDTSPNGKITYWLEFVMDSYDVLVDDIPDLPDPVGVLAAEKPIAIRMRMLIDDARWRVSSANFLKTTASELIQSIDEEYELEESD